MLQAELWFPSQFKSGVYLNVSVSECGMIFPAWSAAIHYFPLAYRLTERNGPQQWVGTAGSNWQRSQAFQDLCSRVGSLFRALGLPVFQAPGEAEATCAALQKQGLVHACATRDSDAFVMGATRVFHTIHLVVSYSSCLLTCMSMHQCQFIVLFL